LTEEGFRKGVDLYFERHDGSAVTCDDFLSAMVDANGVDLGQFSLWFETNGTIQGQNIDHDSFPKKQQRKASPWMMSRKKSQVPLRHDPSDSGGPLRLPLLQTQEAQGLDCKVG
jgi:aminopeptidase N